MKLRNTALMIAALMLTTFCGTSSLSTKAQEALILMRDAEGNVSVTVEEIEDVPEPAVNTLSYTRTDSRGRVIEQASKGEYGEVNYMYDSASFKDYIITDGTELPLTFTFRKPIERWVEDEDTLEIIKTTIGNDFALEGTELHPGDETFPVSGEAMLAQYGENARLYEVQLVGNLVYPNSIYEMLLRNEHILAAFEGRVVTEGRCNWTGEITMQYTLPEGYSEYIENDAGETELTDTGKTLKEVLYESDVATFGQELIDERDALIAERKAWIAEFSAWRDSVDYYNMTPAEREASREAAGIMSEWDMFEKVLDLTERLEASWKETCEREGLPYTGNVIRLWFSVRDTEPHYDAVDFWSTFGDTTLDGVLNAADATQMLNHLAKLGAEDTGSSYVPKYDINFDGEYNAGDAADLLKYLAGQGAGDAMPLKDFSKGFLSPADGA